MSASGNGPSVADMEARIVLALSCLEPVYRLAEAAGQGPWWRRRRGPSIGTVILAERVRRALTEPIADDRGAEQ